MSWFGDLRDLINFRQEWKKRKLELERLERESNQIERPTTADVLRYDPKRKKLLDHIKFNSTLWYILLSAVLALLAALISFFEKSK